MSFASRSLRRKPFNRIKISSATSLIWLNERLGSWKDIQEKKRHYDLMFDAVLNHCSSGSEMFLEFLNGNPAYRDFFIAYESPDDLTPEQRRKIFRPRTSDILTRFETIHGPRYI